MLNSDNSNSSTPVPQSQNSEEIDKILLEFAKQQRQKAYGDAQRRLTAKANEYRQQLAQPGAVADKEKHEAMIWALEQASYSFRGDISFGQVDMSDVGQLPTIPMNQPNK